MEHKQQMIKLQESLDREKEMHFAKLHDEIKRRRAKKQERRKRELAEQEKKASQEYEETERKQILAENEKHASQIKQQLEKVVRPFSPANFLRSRARAEAVAKKPSPLANSSRSPAQLIKGIREISQVASSVGIGSTQAGDKDKDINELLMASPLFEQLTQIEVLLEERNFTVSQQPNPFIDLRDAQWECKGELVPVEVQSLLPADFVVYQFGLFACQLLHSTVQAPRVTVLLASNLPPNNYTHNCFRNSFFYEQSTNVLYVRRERVESVGEFVVVLAHCLAHIKTGDLTNDFSPHFLREFYKVTTLSCAYSYMYRCMHVSANSKHIMQLL